MVYCQQPSKFVDPTHPDHVCLLQKWLYGLKQAPRALYHRFSTYIRRLGFVASTSDTSLFVYKDGDHMAYLLLYVHDIVLAASSSVLLQRLIGHVHLESAMTDLGALHFFLGISITRSPPAFSSRSDMVECGPPLRSPLWTSFNVPAWPSVTPPRH